ncbi:bifunctional metallophosphatase/5'-nucleotidase [Microvirga guangxiensis]|uniref:2',3'-cyclic-nucleotide 2'-phosphodiesterase/5'-or 3'-nucleotidase, 5'-nucleotidase family n=1 Tax=Microvirga guangxiensis TaxID=549386 RepID=A0A1G5KPH7_9HYPH|nr:bifunctional UDP-sugar hydrolase/5'-nucleotidase [Microvirga guangxiensis]SCZ02553.1 2',3'-cyclic-nucleotide 2'-phosphodiesterase/5'-or 3'-nucleotidase, 5'-nucleotidase family [Microvirga guangxiensis]
MLTSRPSAALRAGFLGLSLLLSGTALAQEAVTIRFVQTNDIDRMSPEKGRGGFAKLATVVKEEKAKGNAFFVHAGDTISPSLLSGFDKGAHVIDILNRMGVDAMTPGNHEFDLGDAVFRARMADAKFDVLTSNIVDGDGAPANTKPEKIVDVQGVKVAFFGLTTEETPIASSPGTIKFSSTIDTARAKAKDLRAKGADIVVAVAHTPLEVDMIIARSAGVDLIIGGHDEHLLAFYDGKVALTESESQANYVVVTELSVTKATKDGKTTVSWSPNFRIVDTASVKPDPDIEAVVKGYEDKLSKELDVEIGVTETPLDSRRATVRGGEAAMGNLVADALRAAVGADVAVTNGGGLRADKEYPAGTKLTRRHFQAEMPFGNTTVLMEITGAKLKAGLENGVSQVRELGGRFPQVSGLTFEVDMKEPPGSRVKSLKVNGQDLDPAKTYKLATNDFMARGGDGYGAFAGNKNLIDPSASQLMASQVIDYVTKAGKVAPKVEGRIVMR